MRVITGSARGMKLVTLEGDTTRPTREAVKEALFSMIQFEIEGARVLDMYAGSGQLGIEALSRGAKSCVFTDNSPEAFKIIKQNLAHTKLFDRALVSCCDGLNALNGQEYDIVFVDPPYGMDIMQNILPKIASKMSEGGVIVCESDVHDEMPDVAGDFKMVLSRKYVRTVITLYRKKGSLK